MRLASAFAAVFLVAAVCSGQDRALALRIITHTDTGNPGQYGDSMGSQDRDGRLTIDQLARLARYSQAQSVPDSCRPSRPQIRLTAAQARRLAEQARRQESRERLPKAVQDPERQAAAKYELAHMLWKAGKHNAARLILFNVPIDYPQTAAADKARDVLDRIDAAGRVQYVAAVR
jgi:thioredoxin-like negative regulator of GroEL